ncbi:Response regulator receiver domain-containing protein [Gillisia sp. Hel1_33_143]|uniref:response regulator transcription factor n=1 Tax=unclassified Gillisia TaxID=2615025 RepID=UPI0005573F35|nr:MULTISPECIES: response regulator [unclassified Gillisia]SDS33180.1 Response regulator receiver domain-containing protein [Gillisia sp. Hel1_33_143]
MKKIYLVEDDHALRELISFLLMDKDYEVEAFANAKSFKNKISTADADLILLDIMLPDGNGIDLCKLVKATSNTKDIPVLLMSAHANPSIANDSGANDFIAKPFNVDDLYMHVQKNLA